MTASIEAPRMNDPCLPPGAVAIVSIDPVASVAALTDEQATLEASALPRGKYLAIVDTLVGLDESKPMYEMHLGLSFFCVGRGLPNFPAASLALSPDAPLGNDRPPLPLDPPLPWTDCYVYTVSCFYARISRVHPCAAPRSPTIATEEQWETINGCVAEDQVASDMPLTDAYGEPVDVPDDDCDPDNEPSYDVEGRFMLGKQVARDAVQANGLAAAGQQSYDNRGAPEVRRGSEIEQAEDDLTQDPHQTWPQLEAWLDLTSTTDFDQPAALLHTLRQLTIIVHEAKRRKAIDLLAKRPRTMQWADDVAAAEGATNLDPEHPNKSVAVQVAEDTPIAPEDAIEHRQERAAAHSDRVQSSSRTFPTATSTAKPAKKRAKLSLIGAVNALRLRLRRFRGL